MRISAPSRCEAVPGADAGETLPRGSLALGGGLPRAASGAAPGWGRRSAAAANPSWVPTGGSAGGR